MLEIPREKVLARLRSENPWWSAGQPGEARVFGHLAPRPYLEMVLGLVRASSVKRAVILLGPRRVGKTVLIHHAIGRLLDAGVEGKRIFYVSVDVPLYTDLSLEALLELFEEATGSDCKREQVFLFFDEIQYLRDWERHLKVLVDSFPTSRFLASGSAAAALRLKSNESGAGRFTDFLLPPLTFHEFLHLRKSGELIARLEGTGDWSEAEFMKNLNSEFLTYINFGGYPELALSKELQGDPQRFVKSDIVDKVLLRDLPSLYGIQDIQELNHLFTTLAFCTANEVSLEKLSKSSGVAKNTIKRYIEYLEAAFLIRVVHRVDRNSKRFQRANFFKVYLSNPAIYAALFAPVGADDAAAGHLVETAVFAQWFHLEEPRYYARWDDGEVDLVSLEPNQRPSNATEIKWSDRCIEVPSEIESILTFSKRNKLDRAMVTTRSRLGTRTFPGVKVTFVPSAIYCYWTAKELIGAKSEVFARYFEAPAGSDEKAYKTTDG